MNQLFQKTSFLFILLFAITTYAQEFNGGPLFGFSFSQVDGDSLGGYNKAGPIVGLYISREIKKNIDFKFELKYTQKGSKSKGTPEENADYYELKLHYVEMPLVLSYHYNQRVFFEAGLAEGYLFKVLENGSATGLVDTKENFNNFEASILGGVGFQITDRLSINNRFNYSLFRISKYTSGGRWWLKNGRYNNVVSFAFFYLL